MPEKQINVVRKLTSKTIMGESVKTPTKKEQFLYRIAGVASGIKTGDTQYGPWVAFTGRFSAERNDGAVFASPRAFIPQPFQDMMEAAILQSQAEGDAPSVEFCFDIFVKQAETSIGYEYLVKPVIELKTESVSMLSRAAEVKALPKK